MRGKIRALADGNVPADSDFLDILEQESEDEEMEAARKAREAAERAERRKRRAGRKKAQEEQAQEEDEEGDEGEGEGNGDWEQELEVDPLDPMIDPILLNEGRGDRVEALMQELLKQGGEHQGYENYTEEVEDEGEFELLEGGDEEGEY
jgi:hypothetical protein